MTDDPKRDDTTPDPPADLEQPAAPAVHGTELWGGPRRIEGLPGMPTIATKEEYWRALNDAGLRMQDQQESATGPAPLEPRDIDAPPVLPPVDVPPLSQSEASVLGAFTAILRRYGLKETVWCEDCLARRRMHGCRMLVQSNLVLLKCRCGEAAYRPPVGTTDLVLSNLSQIAKTRLDRTTGSVFTKFGPEARDVVYLHDMEVRLILSYLAVLRRRHKEPLLYHDACCTKGWPKPEDEAIAIAATPEQLILLCKCRQLFWRATPAEPPVVTPRPVVH